MKIGIAGIGGIGSNVAMNLVRSGIDDIKIIDFDKVDESNLNRQFYFYDQIGKNKTDILEENLKRINPNLNIEKNNIKLDENNILKYLADCEIIVEGFDSVEYKKMLIEAFANSDKIIISACGVAGKSLDNIKIKQFGKNVFVIGDFCSDFNFEKIYSTKILVIASIMSNIILEKSGKFDE